jgi:hypothetical protein
MMHTLLLDVQAWDLVLDANNNIAVASEPYSVGVPWMQSLLAKRPSLPLLKAQLVAAALTVPDVASAIAFISAFTNRTISGQIQVVSATTRQTSVANFSVINPQAF